MNWEIEDLELVFITCPRQPNLLPETITSCFISDPLVNNFKNIRIIIDSPELNWIGPLTKNKKIQWLPRQTTDNLIVNSYPIRQRASYNYYRALKSISNEAKGLIICEDDIIFRNNWTKMLIQSLQNIEQDNIYNFMLTLYSSREHDNPRSRRGIFYSSYLEEQFFGTQSMFFTASEIEPISQNVLNDSKTGRIAYDFSISEYGLIKQNLYTTRYSLVQHVGYNSTGLGAFMHTASTFNHPWPSI